MTVALPWAGGDVNGLVAMSGRAAVPFTPAGTGFNWSSLVGRVSGYIRPVRGYSLRGLGQDDGSIATPTVTPVDLSTLGPTTLGPLAPIDLSTLPPAQLPGGVNWGDLATFSNTSAAGGASGASSQAPWYASILGSAIAGGLKVGSQIASYQLNPLTQKATYYQTPQGAVYASNVGAGAVIPGLTTGTSSLLPILLIGGGLLVVMMMSRRS